MQRSRINLPRAGGACYTRHGALTFAAQPSAGGGGLFPAACHLSLRGTAAERSGWIRGSAKSSELSRMPQQSLRPVAEPAGQGLWAAENLRQETCARKLAAENSPLPDRRNRGPREHHASLRPFATAANRVAGLALGNGALAARLWDLTMPARPFCAAIS